MLSRQKNQKEILELKVKLHYMDVVDVYRTFHPTPADTTYQKF
jgi:hypothetical protein